MSTLAEPPVAERSEVSMDGCCSPSEPSESDPAYPKAVREVEHELLGQRRRAVHDALEENTLLGVGLSGGGVRSATFALGIFQALAHKGLLGNIDFLSTVSGGGYFGGFYGALFRRSVPCAKGPSRFDASAVSEVLREQRFPTILRYLRENGSYLAPAGTDDLLLGAATLFRNWLAVQILFLSAIFASLLAAQLGMRAAMEQPSWYGLGAALPLWREFADVGVPLSPWLVPAALMAATWVIPLALSYWAIGRSVPSFVTVRLQRATNVLWTPALFAVLAMGPTVASVTCDQLTLAWFLIGQASLALAIGLLAMRKPDWVLFCSIAGATAPALLVIVPLPPSIPHWCTYLLALGNVPALPQNPHALAFAVWACLLIASCGAIARWRVGAKQEVRGVLDLNADNFGRYELSAGLKVALFATLGVVGFAALDTGARAALLAIDSKSELSAGLAAFMAIGSTLLRRLWPLLSAGPSSTRRMALPEAALARIAGIGLLIALLLAVDMAVHALRPLSSKDLGEVVWVLIMAIAVCMVLGSSRNLLNASTQLPLYSARLIRAYLGASNAKRFCPEPEEQVRRAGTTTPDASAATRVMPDDDLNAECYWGWRTSTHPSVCKHCSANGPHASGAPLHLVNVTVNETVDGRSQIQQGDRKGLGLAIGPAGFSAGVRHHAVLKDQKWQVSPPAPEWRVFRFIEEDSAAKSLISKIFGWLDRQHERAHFPMDKLSLGQWLGISGAAFSTGLGARTNLGLSILAALANVRLGFWWRPGTLARLSWPHRIAALFWVQSYLFRELLARFPGTSRALWYLSDGGHFENMGGYELIRRKLPYILIVDAEADPDYRGEGLGNLVRKARIDFGATIEFVSNPQLDFEVPSYVGDLEHLRRGSWARKDFGWELEEEKQSGLSRAHAALARIKYAGGSQEGWLLYVKPTLVGSEPADLTQYHVAHPAFPHESTGDQFFDEAQWESYRALGELIGERLLEHNGVLLQLCDRRLPLSATRERAAAE